MRFFLIWLQFQLGYFLATQNKLGILKKSIPDLNVLDLQIRTSFISAKRNDEESKQLIAYSRIVSCLQWLF